MRYASNPLTKRNHFGHVGGVDPNLLFSLWKTIPAFTSTNEEHQACLNKGAASMLRELILARDLSPTIACSGNQCFFLELPSKRMTRFCLTGITSSSVKLGSTASSALTWNGCFYCHIYNLYLIPGTWTGIWSERNQAS